ncbi:hypothetical protein ACGMNB_18445 [Shewanella oncorhynchi]|uniref:hypothetical protein n=1 Tax=Shewanella oncorhynchi TaxID=2726434 RepID=UPI003744CB9A
MNIIKQKGRILALVLPLSLAGTISASIFSYFSSLVPSGGPVPYIIVSIFLLPIAAIWPMFKDLPELRDLDSATYSERNRLATMIIEVQQYLKISAFLLLAFGIISGITLYLVEIHAISAKLVLGGIGFFLGCSVYIFIFLINIRIKLQNFKSLLINRMIDLKQTKKLLDKIKNKSDKS